MKVPKEIQCPGRRSTAFSTTSDAGVQAAAEIVAVISSDIDSDEDSGRLPKKTVSSAASSSSTSSLTSSPYKMLLSGRFLLGTLALSCLVSFSAGRVCHHILHEGVKRVRSTIRTSAGSEVPYGAPPSPLPSEHQSHPVLPHPVLPEGKPVPSTMYSSKQFDTSMTVSSDNILLSHPPHLPQGHDHSATVEITEAGESRAALKELIPEDYVEELHQPAGQHLLVDIENVDGLFLNSEERLAEAMVTLVQESGLTMLSYHCHALAPMGVSCMGVLLESHVSFHTWPIPGVITLDVFTCGPKPLLPLLESIEKLFGIPKTYDDTDGGDMNDPANQPHTVWSFKKRGFPDLHSAGDETSRNPEDVDLDEFLLGYMDFEAKAEVASVQTDFQNIEIFDVINPRFRTLEEYYQSVSGKSEDAASYQSQHPEFYRPDRIVYLDKIMQSRLYGEAAYHETLVHPALFAHPDARRVAIIGGGEGATLREALKHKTVERVTMVEIDEVMVNVSRQYLPEWSDCSMLEGSSGGSCFDDPRAEVVFTDAIAWFVENFGAKETVKEEDRYDIIIMDALDPSSVVAFSDVLYNNNELMASFSNALTDQGILVAQIGQSSFLVDPPREYTRESVIDDAFILQLQDNGFKKITDYEDSHGGFLGVWNLLVAFKGDLSSERWYADEASVNLEIRRRILPTVTGQSPLRFFDGATMKALSYPTRVHEELFCRKDSVPTFCDYGHGFDPARDNVPLSALEVKSDSGGTTHGLFTKQEISAGSYVALEERTNDILVPPQTRYLLNKLFAWSQKKFPTLSWPLLDSRATARSLSFRQDSSYSIDAGVPTSFVGHGCNGTANLGYNLSVSEMTADPLVIPFDVDSFGRLSAYSPFLDRNRHTLQSALEFTKVPIRAGSELLDNYLAYLQPQSWEHGILHIRSMCTSKPDLAN